MVIVDTPWETKLELLWNDLVSIGNWFAGILNF